MDFDPRDFDDARDGQRWDLERDNDGRDRELDDCDRGDDARDTLTSGLDLPRGQEREIVRDRDHEYELNADECRTLAAAGAFRVVAERDLQDSTDALRETLNHLRDEGLLQTVPIDERDRAVVLTDRGRELLEANRRPDARHRQTFYSGADRPRDRSHDATVYRAYLKTAERLRGEGARIERVVLDRELKRDYQRFLQDRNRGRSDSDGRPDRDEDEIREWAKDNALPYFDGQVHFPDARVEYYTADRGLEREDIEVVTGHYRGGHAAAASWSGFTLYRGGAASGARGVPFDPRGAERLV